MRSAHALVLSFCVFALSGCDQPSPRIWGAQPIYGAAAGYDVTLWRKGNAVELIRHGYAPRRDQPALRAAMARAIADLSGCALRPGTLDGDTGVLRATLDCP